MTTLPPSSLALSVVVPCYNEIESLPNLLSRLHDVCRSVSKYYEIILVDDGSTDGTAQAINHATETFPNIVGVHLARRYGQQIALSAGLAECKGERILIIDADLQDPPELLPNMLALMENGADVVYGVRQRRIGESRFKILSARLFYRFMRWASEEAIPVDTGDFRLISRRVWEQLQQMPERQRYLRGMIAWVGLNQVPMSYARMERKLGTTKYPLWRMMGLAMDAITSFSAAPLRLSLGLSLLCGGLTILLLLYVLGAWAMGDTVAGWTSLSCIMLFFFGLQFFCIGMIGEYVGRIYLEGKRRPLFVVDKIARSKDTTDAANRWNPF